jgi:hypothetical protein
MSTTRFSIRRLLLGTMFVALPFAVFGRYGQSGVIVSIFIAVPMFIACCIASRDQLQSMFGIIACTAFGLFIGALFPSVGRRYDMAMKITVYAMSGRAVGLLWSEIFYAKQARENASKMIDD